MTKPLEMNEGPEAFDRFRKAMKAIVSVRKSDAMIDHPKQRAKKKKPANRKG